jgi:hypothetical protein
MGDPVPNRSEPRGDEAIAAFSAMPLLRDETGIQQDAKVLGDRWAAHLEMSRNRVHRAVVLDEEIEHPAARGMADRPKDIRLPIGNHNHGSNIRKIKLTRQARSQACCSERDSLKYACMTHRGEDLSVHQSLCRFLDILISDSFVVPQ